MIYASNQRIVIGLPIYNESGSILTLLEKIIAFMEYRKLSYSIVLYNDGSSDNSLLKCEEFQKKHEDSVHIIDSKLNKGLGVGLKELILYGINNYENDDILIIMDSDNTHNPEHIYRMINKIRDGFDVVIASRYTNDSRIVGLTKFRKFLSLCASYMFRMLFPIKGVKDYTCGYRAYNLSKLKEAYLIYGDDLITETGFACMAELLVKLRAINVLASEVPLILRYDRKVDDSKMKILKTVANTIILALRRY